MIKRYAVALSLLLFSAAGASAFQFTIKGTFASKPAADKIYLYLAGSGAQPVSTKLDIVGGKFSYTGAADEPKQCLLSWTEAVPQDRSKYLSFIIDEGIITVSIDQDIANARVSGSKSYSELQEFIAAQKVMQPEFEKFNQDAQAATQRSNNMDSLRKVFMPRMEALQKKANLEQVKFIKSHPKSFVSLIVISESSAASKDYLLADTLFETLAAEIKNLPTGKAIKELIESEKRIAVGAIAPDFEQNDLNGNSIKLSSLRGKYVLVDFWASWCGPCRQENPNVVQAYNTFKDKNFTILGVSIDTDRSNWLKAIKDDGLTWAQVSDLKQDNAAAILYRVLTIPQNYLIDDKGVIIARNLRGPELETALRKFLKAD